MSKVLVVDDSESVRISLRQILLIDKHEVIEASDGSEALRALDENEDINVVILDVNMPIMNGIEVIEELAAKNAHEGIPIIMCSTEGHPKVIIRAKETGRATAWIRKPIDSGAFRRTLNKVLEKRGKK